MTAPAVGIIRYMVMRERLAAIIAKKDAGRGRPLTDREKLRNLNHALWPRGHHPKEYTAPPPVYATCPSCRATVRVLPSGRWARHVESPGVRGRCWRGGRMRS